MSNEGLGDSVAELWSQIGVRRITADDNRGGLRALKAANSLRYTEKLRRDDWFVSGHALAFGAPRTGRGWYDAHRPAKLGA